MKRKRKIKPLRLLIVLTIIFVLIFSIYLGIKRIVNYINEKIEIANIIGINDLDNKDSYLLAVNDDLELHFSIDTKNGETNKTLSYSSSNEEIISVSQSGLVSAISIGEANVTVSILDYSKTINFEVTDKLLPCTYESSLNKPYLKENTYTNEENEILDEYLKLRVNEAGYKTREGVVAAAKFISMELPYRVDYFYENGRISNGVDGEGRYYHEGLYLSESKYSTIDTNLVWYGKAYWGKSLFAYNEDAYNENGLDCSGYITWILLNGGYDPGDLGAPSKYNEENSLLKLGDKIMITNETANNLKPGDLVFNYELSGHVGMLIDKDENYFYVTQSIWYDTTGVVVTRYSLDEFVSHWINACDMDKFYNN